MRLNKLLASRGIASRRACDELISQGDVRVNGEVIRELGTRVDPEHDRIMVRGKPIPGRVTLRYYMLHKPVGIITTMSDPEGRPTIREFLPPGARLFPVGRLDADTSGLLLLTNDGELAHHLMHPRYGVRKVYRVRVPGMPTANQLDRLRRGVEFEPGIRSASADVRLRAEDPNRPLVEIIVHEGRYRQVRRMFEAVGLTVTGLHRAGYGPLRLGELRRGDVRALDEDEIAELKQDSARPTRPKRRGPGVGPASRPTGAPRPARAEPKPAETQP
ncbi:MAG: rRNA pseudouridine synthase, partial [Candidatus Eisenbacteria bacterium]|nr:rRNA pseudouridine synthase [Candidatus Eisenbacteria bacterium]